MNTISIEKKRNYAIVQLNRGKANVINIDMVQELRAAFAELKEDDAIRGVILTGQDHFFSAGLDVIELYGYDEEEIAAFMTEFGNLYIELATFPKAFISAISGHSPAGGTVMAICSDYRIMAQGPKYVIGLNEVAVSIQISEDIVKGYAFWIGEGTAAKMLLDGKLMKVDEAHAIGLVDEVCELSELMAKAEAKMKYYLQFDDAIFRSTKYKCRKAWIDTLSQNGEAAFKETLETWWRPDIRQRMGMMVAMLQSKKG